MFSSGRSTLFIAALLHLASASRQTQTLSEHIKEHTNSKMSACGSDMSLATLESSSSSTAYIDRQYSSPIGYPFVSQKQNAATNRLSGDMSPDKLDEIWRRCQSSHPMTRELLTHGKLVSIEETNEVCHPNVRWMIQFSESTVATTIPRHSNSQYYQQNGVKMLMQD